jgi:muramoyltetrapeptide carboxypeptidase LdcA involved in peptidoglycan recycling
LADLTRNFEGPVIYGFPSGHTIGPLLTLPLGVEARVVAAGAPRLVIEEAGVQ